MATGTSVTGLRETIRALEKLGVEADDLKDAFADISADVVTEARSIVKVRTGRLQSSIRAARTKSKAVVRAGSAAIGYARQQDRRTEFLTGPANTDTAGRARKLDDNLQALIRKYDLN